MTDGKFKGDRPLIDGEVVELKRVEEVVHRAQRLTLEFLNTKDRLARIRMRAKFQSLLLEFRLILNRNGVRPE